MLSGLIMQAAAVAMAGQPAPVAAPDDMAQQLEWAQDCQPHSGERDEVADWAIIDAREMTRADELRAALDKVSDGRRPVILWGEFPGADMRPLAPRLNGACFYQTNLAGSNWDGVRIARLQMERVSFREASAKGSIFAGLVTRGTSFAGADFSNADLSIMRFVSQYQGANFDGTSFRNARLRGARFYCDITVDVACYGTPDFTDADLTGADISGLGLWYPDRVAGALLDNTRVSPLSLPALGGAKIRDGVILTHFASVPYLDYDGPPAPTAKINAAEARSLIAATIREVEKREPANASFPCDKASTQVEAIICGPYDGHLRQLDLRLAAAWSEARGAGKADIAAQRAWLKQRNRCEDRVCIEDAYQTRIAQILGATGTGIVIAPDQTFEYSSDVLPLPRSMHEGQLYSRIVPVLKHTSRQSITLTGREDGTIAVDGDAIGANAHLCGLDVPDARFDAATGWWSATGPDGRLVPIFRIDGDRFIPRYSGNSDTPVEARDFISCGARAFFSEGVRLEVN